MMKRIDLVGLSGVGKSTVLDALSGRNNRGKRNVAWHTAKDALKIVAQQKTKETKGIFNNLCYYLIEFEGLKRVLIHHYTYKLKANLFINQWSKVNRTFLSECLSILRNASINQMPDSIAEQYFRIRWLLNTAENIALLEEYFSDGCILYDESLIQKTVYLLTSVKSSIEDAKPVFDSIPHPAGIIYFNSDPDLSVNRLLKRVNGIERRKETENVIQEAHCAHIYFKELIVRLRNKGIPILDVDAAKPINQQVDVIQAFLEEDK
jgi:nuclear transport factor 2 (NTF2) superfamily protein